VSLGDLNQLNCVMQLDATCYSNASAAGAFYFITLFLQL